VSLGATGVSDWVTVAYPLAIAFLGTLLAAITLSGR
jgi:hypothetical protein